MPFAPGEKLGPYEITALIGQGGMGEVYKATDTRLNRTVALKVSKTEFSERFEHEAKAVAALNHPHICQVYDVGPNYLVLEFVDGVPLAGPLPLEKALEYAGQIASALDAAHTRKITHRDLKPANILVTRQGVKLLDFGLAKVESPVGVDDETRTMGLTMKGQILGTLLYMAPEQLHGQDITPRTDIFSFGLVLYEMLTGKRAFDGGTAASVISAILERPAPSIADVAPPALDRVLKRCMEKDPEQRWQSARDVRAALEMAAIPVPTAKPVMLAPPARESRWPWITAAVFAVIAGAALWAPWRATPPAPLAANLTILPPEGASLGELAISPDSRTLAFVALHEGERRIFLRPLDRADAQPLKGSEDAFTLFWSPDSRRIGFFTSQAIKKIDLATGVTSTLYNLPERVATYDSGTWEDGTILFSLNPPSRSAIVGLYRISESGGQATRVTTIDKKEAEVWHTRPHFLPGGRRFLYTILSNQGAAYTGIFLGSLDSAEKKRLIRGPSRAIYAPSGNSPAGRVYFGPPNNGNPGIFWQSFNPAIGELLGDPVHLVDGVNTNYATAANISVSRNGVLVFHPTGTSTRELRWFARDGKPAEAIPGNALPSEFSLSQDERKLIGPGPGTSRAAGAPRRSIWILDLARAGVPARLTFDDNMEDRDPQWSPDGSRFIFYRKIPGAPTGEFKVFVKSANGTGQEELLLKTDTSLVLDQWSPKGNYLVYGLAGQQTGRDLWVLPLAGADRTPKPYAQTETGEVAGRLSPDEHWMAYSNIVGGLQQVIVRPFPNYGGGQWQVSMGGGGDRPMWRADGKELFYLAPDGKLMSVVVTLPTGAGTPTFGQPQLLFQTDGYGIATSGYAPSRDGQRFLFIANSTSSAPVTVLLNAN